ncbi:MAG TPA: cytochrome P450 [Hyphomicrobiaceae bacterium]|nr:cytochrome P450 [Hyphomicrobiaceae bacterium]
MAVEECLRFVPPVQFSKPRFVRKDLELGGVRLRKGRRITAMIVAARGQCATGAASHWTTITPFMPAS